MDIFSLFFLNQHLIGTAKQPSLTLNLRAPETEVNILCKEDKNSLEEERTVAVARPEEKREGDR